MWVIWVRLMRCSWLRNELDCNDQQMDTLDYALDRGKRGTSGPKPLTINRLQTVCFQQVRDAFPSFRGLFPTLSRIFAVCSQFFGEPREDGVRVEFEFAGLAGASLGAGKSLDDLLVPAFATVREAAKRVLGQRHFDVQLIGGMVLRIGDKVYDGSIATQLQRLREHQSGI